MIRALWLLLAAALLSVSCQPEGGEHKRVTTSPVDNAEGLSEPLMVALMIARNHHHRADIFLKDGQVDEAIAEVRAILALSFPAGAPEAEDARLDARARLAKLLVTAGRLDEARRVVDEGLAAATRESFFVANLHMVSGEVYHAQARALDESAPEAARALRKKALEAHDRSIDINKAIQKKIFEEATR